MFYGYTWLYKSGDIKELIYAYLWSVVLGLTLAVYSSLRFVSYGDSNKNFADLCCLVL